MCKTNTVFSFSASKQNAEDEESMLLRKTGVVMTATRNTISRSHLNLTEQMSEDDLKRRPVEWKEKYKKEEMESLTKTGASVKVSVQTLTFFFL